MRLVLDDSTDSDVVLEAARSAGRVTEFVFKRRRLSEVFREAVGGEGAPVILAAIAVLLVRLGLRRRGGGDPHGWRLAGPRGRSSWETGLVAGREIRERVRGRVFEW